LPDGLLDNAVFPDSGDIRPMRDLVKT